MHAASQFAARYQGVTASPAATRASGKAGVAVPRVMFAGERYHTQVTGQDVADVLRTIFRASTKEAGPDAFRRRVDRRLDFVGMNVIDKVQPVVGSTAIGFVFRILAQQGRVNREAVGFHAVHGV